MYIVQAHICKDINYIYLSLGKAAIHRNCANSMAGTISGNGTQNLNKLFVPENNHIPSKHKETKFFFIRKIPF